LSANSGSIFKIRDVSDSFIFHFTMTIFSIWLSNGFSLGFAIRQKSLPKACFQEPMRCRS
jgi:hypothetical protein